MARVDHRTQEVTSPATRPTTRPPAREVWRTPFVQAFTWVTITRLATFAIAYAATWLLSTDTKGPHVASFVAIWDRWDTVHFVNIAQHGYSASHGFFSHDAAFFPLYPLLMRGLSFLGGPVVAGLIISYLASIVACAYLFKLAEEQIGLGAGTSAISFLLLAPTGVFLAAAYSESLFLAGAIAAFYFGRRRSWLLAGVAGAVAMGARAAGIFLLVGLVVEFVAQRDFRPARLLEAGGGALLVLVPLIAYMGYLWATKNDPFYFLAAQKAGWYRTFVGPVQSLRATWETWNAGQPTNWIFAWRIEVLAAVAGLIFTIWALTKRWWGYGAYMIATLAYLLTSTWYFSVPRLLLGLFPIFLLLAGWAHTPLRRELVIAPMAIVMAMGVVVFTQGAWYF